MFASDHITFATHKLKPNNGQSKALTFERFENRSCIQEQTVMFPSPTVSYPG
jgi:hypothetical protein